jgi:hypothetical protein
MDAGHIMTVMRNHALDSAVIEYEGGLRKVAPEWGNPLALATASSVVVPYARGPYPTVVAV